MPDIHISTFYVSAMFCRVGGNTSINRHKDRQNNPAVIQFCESPRISCKLHSRICILRGFNSPGRISVRAPSSRADGRMAVSDMVSIRNPIASCASARNPLFVLFHQIHSVGDRGNFCIAFPKAESLRLSGADRHLNPDCSINIHVTTELFTSRPT